jgi:hydrogenase/urease accessory protein HupE
VNIYRLVCFLLLPLLCAPAQAHRFAPSLLRLVEIGENEYNVVWKTPAQATSAIPLQPVLPDECAAAGDGAGEMEGTGVVRSFRVHCPGGLVGKTLSVSGLAENQASVLASLETADQRFYQALLNTEQDEFQIPEEPTAVAVMQEYTVLGTEHIWGGIDHLLFVFGLLLLVGGGRRLVWTITSFTVGHSVTLSAVTLGYFEFPVALVEFTIALSIFVLALELAREDRSGLFSHYPWWLAGAFGLLHGMGFAGALAEVGLPQSELPLALLFFNIGIEVGQLAFIFAAIGVWMVFRKLVRQWQRQLLPVPVYVLGSLSAMWCIERGLEVF